MIQIGLDARTLTHAQPRGTGRNLLDAYRYVPALRPDWHFVLYHQRPAPENVLTALARHRNVTWTQIDTPGDRVDAWLQFRLPLAAWSDRITLLHLPANTAPRWCPVPFVTTIHDLAPLEVPGELPPAATRAFERGVQRAMRKAARLIAPSSATAAALAQRYGVCAADVSIVPWAPDEQIAQAANHPLSPERASALQARYELAAPWLLNFSGASPRKNARRLLEAFAQTTARQTHQLVLVGCTPDEERAALAAQARALGIADRCRLLGYLPLDTLTDLLRLSSGLLIPSLCEGFGLPVLDAFACQTPVLAADQASLPEVVGDAAVYCNPRDPASIAAGIDDLIQTATRTRLVAAGTARLSNYTWPTTATKLVEAYEAGLAAASGCAATVTEGSA